MIGGLKMIMNEGDRMYDYEAFKKDPQWHKIRDDFETDKDYLKYKEERKNARNEILSLDKQTWHTKKFKEIGSRKKKRTNKLKKKQEEQDAKFLQATLLDFFKVQSGEASKK